MIDIGKDCTFCLWMECGDSISVVLKGAEWSIMFEFWKFTIFSALSYINVLKYGSVDLVLGLEGHLPVVRSQQ